MPQVREPFDAMHMSNQRGYEVQRTNHFEAHIIDVGGESITLAVENTNLPTISTEQIELDYGNTNVKVAGKTTVEDVTLVVKDFIMIDIQRLVENWRKQVYNQETGETGWAQEYKKTGYLYEYSPKGDITRGWRLEGIWPSSVNPGDLNYESSDKKTIDITLSVDMAYLERAMA